MEQALLREGFGATGFKGAVQRRGFSALYPASDWRSASSQCVGSTLEPASETWMGCFGRTLEAHGRAKIQCQGYVYLSLVAKMSDLCWWCMQPVLKEQCVILKLKRGKDHIEEVPLHLECFTEAGEEFKKL
jgi:hypothetical protein